MTSSSGPLRLGLLLDEPRIPWWIAPALLAVTQRKIAVVALMVVRRNPPTAAPTLRVLRWWRNRHVLGFALLARWDRWRARRDTLPEDLPLGDGLAEVPTLEVVPETTRYVDRLTASDVEQIRSYDLDVLVRIGFRILRGPILSAARHGTWSFHHGDNRLYRGGPPGVWEVLHDREESGITLQRLTEELDGGVVLARSIRPTRRFSFERNLRGLLRRSPSLLIRSLERLYRGEDPTQNSVADPRWDAYGQRLYREPTNLELLRWLPRLSARYLAQRTRSAGKQLQWSLAWQYTPSADPDAPSGVFHRYREIRPPKDRFWADPFVVRDGSRWWMFFEEYRYAEARGEIAVWEMSPAGPVASSRPVLARPYHLSYPQVFRHESRWYLLPETAAERRVELYRAVRFPDEWVAESTLLDDVKALDPTLLCHEGRWYLFASLDDELHAFHATGPFGPFVPHAANPLVTDIRWARMAGRFFHSGGRLYRPAQWGSPTYGAGLAITEVTELTPVSYRERLVHRIMPEWNSQLCGIHSLSAADGLSAVDFLRLVRR